jgi:hypothetical protein
MPNCLDLDLLGEEALEPYCSERKCPEPGFNFLVKGSNFRNVGRLGEISNTPFYEALEKADLPKSASKAWLRSQGAEASAGVFKGSWLVVRRNERNFFYENQNPSPNYICTHQHRVKEGLS